jgi:hypothetical protein
MNIAASNLIIAIYINTGKLATGIDRPPFFPRLFFSLSVDVCPTTNYLV